MPDDKKENKEQKKDFRKQWKGGLEQLPPHHWTLDEIKEDEKLHGLVDEDHPFPSKGN